MNIKKAIAVCVAFGCIIAGSILTYSAYTRGASTKFRISYKDKTVDTDVEKNSKENYDIDSNEINEINVNSKYCDLEVKEGESYSVTYEGDTKYKPDVTIKDGVIDILQDKISKENGRFNINFNINFGVMTLDKTGLTFGIIPKTAKIIITVPYGEKINCIECESDYGDISVSDVEVKNIDITSNYGDLRFKNLKCDELETKQDFGDVKFDGSLIGNIDIESSYGDIDFDIDGDEDDYNMDITTKCGDVDINDEEYEKKNVVINNDGNNNITLDVSYGDVEINIR